MSEHEFIAKNSKIQILFLFIPAIILIIVSFILILKGTLSGEILIFLITAGILIISSIHFFFQPRVAIETQDNVITFYKRNKIFSFNITDIKKVQINTNWGSFDTKIYTDFGKKKTFHFLVENSTVKKDEYIKFFKDRNIKVFEIDLS